MRFASDGGAQILRGFTDRQAGRGVADRFEVLKVPMGMASFALGGRAEHGGYVIVALDVGFLCEIKIPPVRLGFPGKSVFQIAIRSSSRSELPCSSPSKT